MFIVGAFTMCEGSSFHKLIAAGKKLCLYALTLLKGRYNLKLWPLV